MIKKIVFKKTNTLQDNFIEIDFSKNVNIIIGPKGGGKSTLFDLLAAIKNGYIPKSVIDTLKNFNLEFVKAINFNNEEILANSLNKKNKKEMEEDFKNRNDVIYQDDVIKKDINSFPQIEKQKYDFVKESIYKDEEISKFIDKLKSFYKKISIICNLKNNNNINWSNIFKIKNLLSTNNLIIKLNYSNNEFDSKIKDELNTINYMFSKNNDNLQNYKSYLNKNFNQVIENEVFNKSYISNIKNIILNLENFNETLKIKEKELKRIQKFLNIFNNVFKKEIELIKENDFTDTIKHFVIQANDFFIENAKQGYEFKKIFKEFIKDSFILNIQSYKKEYELLSYEIKSEIILNEAELYSILSVFLHTPKSKNDVYKWIDENNKENMKEFSEEKIINKLASILKDKVIVLADNKNYEQMSFGQRSIYGIKYKFNRSLKEDLFLDQPEDNLDNYTIATNILDLVNSKNDNQIFIVTHNANIGILTKPGKTILADLNNEEIPYSNGKIESIKENESASAHFLEGGVKFLEDRYKIIKGN